MSNIKHAERQIPISAFSPHGAFFMSTVARVLDVLIVPTQRRCNALVQSEAGKTLLNLQMARAMMNSRITMLYHCDVMSSREEKLPQLFM
jgi:hypothetical protein